MRASTVGLIAGCFVFRAAPAQPQPVPETAGRDSAAVAAGVRYQAGWLTRFFLGDTHRNLWTTPIRVPVLDLRRFAGGLTPTKVGGGNQTKSLRFDSADGQEYVFRLSDKHRVTIPKGYQNTLVETIARDQVSAQHPAGAVVAAEVLAAVGVLHVTPFLTVLPDDSLLGEFREFAGLLGMLEPYPAIADDVPALGGANDIIDSDSLRARLDRDPAVRVDARAYLVARLTDMFLGDWDRHAGNWRWALIGPSASAAWLPIARDRDKVFVTVGGIVAAGGRFVPHLMVYRATYPAVRGFTTNSLELDRRLLIPLGKAEWDSIAGGLPHKITDAVIDAAVKRMPAEYRHTAPALTAAMRARRDSIPSIAHRFYLLLAASPDIHATDAAEEATVIRLADGSVDVELRSATGASWFRRRFLPAETDEIRLYLHGGDDRAVVVGDVPTSLPVRIIGGNGTNTLIDSSRVAGRGDQATLDDGGRVSDVRYGSDSLWNRRPWIRSDEGFVVPGRDRGSSLRPVFGLSYPGDVGLLLRVGVRRTGFGFRVAPFAQREALMAEYAIGVDGWRVTGSIDRRRRGTALHLVSQARMSELEVTEYYGLGNATEDLPAISSRVRQRQWSLQPALAVSLGTRSEVTIGPVLQVSTTDSLPGNFLSTSRPYGFGDFGQVGLRLGIVFDRRDRAKEPRRGVLLDLRGGWYPGVWDVKTPFGRLDAVAASYLTLPVPLRPILLLRASARKRFGQFPFHEAAFIGGRGSVRALDRQRYAGDASLDGTAELQIPIGRVVFLLPFNLGIYGFGDAGRVYLDGRSPEGWHAGTGIGLSIGIADPSPLFAVEVGNSGGRSLWRVRTGVNF